VTEVADLLTALNGIREPAARVEFNIEGDPRPDLLAMVHTVRPTQCTLVPVRPGEITSQAGWLADTPRDVIGRVIGELRGAGIRVSLFVDPEEAPIRWAAEIGADRVELYTEPFARAYERGGADARESFDVYTRAAEQAHSLGLGINAGHDLDLQNLVLFRNLPHLEEVSIGHALISHALFVGLDRSVRDYLEVLRTR
jgi:pyridoxine 5-phosphate synthase